MEDKKEYIKIELDHILIDSSLLKNIKELESKDKLDSIFQEIIKLKILYQKNSLDRVTYDEYVRNIWRFKCEGVIDVLKILSKFK